MAAGPHKVVLIGPVLPFRGGIAQHTTMLLHAFREFTDAQAISFTRQYPKLIFPGESDRDPAFEGHVEPHTTYLIDSVNPLTWRKAVKLAIAEKPDVVVLPWWQVYWAPSFSYIARRIRRAGIPVVFLCHNVTEHEAAGWKRALTKRVLALGSGHVVQTNLDAEHLLELLPDAKPVLHLHPAYDQFPRRARHAPSRARPGAAVLRLRAPVQGPRPAHRGARRCFLPTSTCASPSPASSGTAPRRPSSASPSSAWPTRSRS